MSADEQADAYLDEARLTRSSARAIYQAAIGSDETLWADVVKNGYDANDPNVRTQFDGLNIRNCLGRAVRIVT